jgi:hypothetical protein
MEVRDTCHATQLVARANHIRYGRTDPHRSCGGAREHCFRPQSVLWCANVLTECCPRWEAWHRAAPPTATPRSYVGGCTVCMGCCCVVGHTGGWAEDDHRKAPWACTPGTERPVYGACLVLTTFCSALRCAALRCAAL